MASTLFTTSVIIPAFNEEKNIGHCIEAIQASGAQFLEILVIDNGSVDGTKKVAEKYPGVKVIDETRKGVTRARQKGADEAKGDLLVFIDADNTLPSQWYETMISEFEKDKKLGCLSGPYVYTDVPFIMRIAVAIYWYIFAYPTYLILGYMAVAGNMVIKKEVFEKMGGFDTRIEFYGDDTDTARRAKQFGRMKFSLDLVMYSSGRRFSNQGLLKTATLYVSNFFSQVVAHKSITNSNQYKDFR